MIAMWSLVFLGGSFLLSSILTFFLDDRFTQAYYTFSAVWMGFASYIFLATILYAVVHLIVGWFAPGLSVSWFGMLCFLVAIVASSYGLIHARNIIIKDVQISLPNISSAWSDKKIVWISDIHLGAVHGAGFTSKIVYEINSINPDLVFIGGDLFDGVKVETSAVIAPFSGLHPALGTYFITGNHEEFRDNSLLLQSIRDIGIRVLDNKMVTLDGLQIIGVDDRDSIDKDKFSSILTSLNMDKAKPSLLLKHQPSQLDIAEKAGISMQISGHTHRAQMFPLNIFSYFIFNGYDYGLNRWGNMLEYTSSGVGTWGPPIRVGSDSEIVVMHISNK